MGTYYRNGHAKFETPDGAKVMHPFDADGMVSAATFMGNGTVYFRNRYVRTAGFQKEMRAGKAMYPGTFGNAQPFWAGGTKPKNVANTNVIWWGGRLLALWEGGQPYKLDPLSLGTAGATGLNGVIPPGESLSAHPRYCAATDRLVGFSYNPSPLTGATSVKLFEFDRSFALVEPPQGAPRFPRVVNLKGTFGLFHDFAVTEKYLVFTVAPQTLDTSKGLDLLLGRKAIGEAIAFDGSKPATMAVLSRATGALVAAVPVDTHFNFHYANAFEDVDGRVVVDTVRAARLELGEMEAGRRSGQPVWETVDMGKDVPPSALYRYTLDLKAKGGEGQWVAPAERLCDRPLDFPVVNPRVSARAHRYVWAACGAALPKAGEPEGFAAAPPQGIVKVDTAHKGAELAWFPEPHQFCGEPCFARRRKASPEETDAAAEDDGYILTLVTDGKKSTTDLVVLDASTLALVGRVDVGTNLPHGLHGSWAEDLTPSLEDLDRAQVLLKMFERKSKEWNQVDASFSGLGIGQFFGQKGVDGR